MIMTTVWVMHRGAEVRWRTFAVNGGAQAIIRDDRTNRRWADATKDVVPDDEVEEAPEPAATFNREVLDWQLDWRDNRRSYQPRACIHCGRLTQLLNDSGHPSHKVCAERALEARPRRKSAWRADPDIEEGPPPADPDPEDEHPGLDGPT
jgi:hypothetical protein